MRNRKRPDGKVRVVVYRRVSADEQHLRGYSLETQYNDCVAACDARHGPGNYDLTDICEPGLSGDYPPPGPGIPRSKCRPALGRVLDMINGGEVDELMVKDLDRLTRQELLAFTILDAITRNDVELVSVDDNLDCSNPLGLFMYGIKSLLSAYERRQIRHRIVDGLKSRRRAKYWHGNPPLGWRRQGKANLAAGQRPSLVKDEKAAETIRLIYDLFLAHKGVWAIIRELCRRGIPSPWGKPTWSYRTVVSELRTPCHPGLIMVDGELQQAAHFEQRIVEPDEYHRVQEMMSSRKRVGPATHSSTNHLLAGLARCGSCGKRLYLVTPATGTRFYRCFSRRPQDGI